MAPGCGISIGHGSGPLPPVFCPPVPPVWPLPPVPIFPALPAFEDPALPPLPPEPPVLVSPLQPDAAVEPKAVISTIPNRASKRFIRHHFLRYKEEEPREGSAQACAWLAADGNVHAAGLEPAASTGANEDLGRVCLVVVVPAAVGVPGAGLEIVDLRHFLGGHVAGGVGDLHLLEVDLHGGLRRRRDLVAARELGVGHVAQR